MNAAEYLGLSSPPSAASGAGRDKAGSGTGGVWRFSVDERLHGAFGGMFGGAVAAACVIAARPLAAGRVPAALDCRFLRGLPAGDATVRASVLHSGRSLAAVDVEVRDGQDRLATRATVSLVAPGALADVDGGAVDGDSAGAGVTATPGEGEGTPWGAVAPIAAALAPRLLPFRDDGGVATAFAMPWDDPDAGAEAACMAADLCVGPPVAAGLGGRRHPHPNPDLSLRFTPGPAPAAGRDIVGVGRLAALQGGLAVVAIDVYAAGATLASGVSCSMILDTGSNGAP